MDMNIAELFFKKDVKKNIQKQKIQIENGVEYSYVKTKNAKFLKIAIKGGDKVRVTVPFGCSFQEAETFVCKKKDWIKSHIERFEFSKIDENFETKTGNLIITGGLTEKPVIKKTGGVVQFIYPIGSDFYSDENQKMAKLAIKAALKIEGENYLPKRLKELAEKFNFKYKKVFLKTQKTRWGSCSYFNNINLNINLMTLSDDLIDYVLVHELCHTKEKNHGVGFWNLMEKCMPDAKKLRYELKKKEFIV